MIRDASDNQSSLDTVMRELYETTYKKGKGSRTTNGGQQYPARRVENRSRISSERYVDGREPFPYDSVLPLGGLKLFVERTVRPSLGISVSGDDEGLRVMQVVVAGPGATAGVKLGDYLFKVGGLDAADPGFQEKFNAKYGGMAPGGTIPIEIKRGTQRLTLNAPVKFNTTEARRLIEVDERVSKSGQGTRRPVERYASTVAASRGDGPFHFSFIIASISLISRGAREIHSTPLSVAM